MTPAFRLGGALRTLGWLLALTLATCVHRPAPSALRPSWGSADRASRTLGLAQVSFDAGVPSVFVDAELGAVEQEGCVPPPHAAACRWEFETVLFDLRPSGLPRLADLVADGAAAGGGLEQELVSRHGPVHLQVKLDREGGLVYQVVFPPEAEFDEQPIAGTRVAALSDFGVAVKAASGVLPSRLALLEYSDWSFRPRVDAPVNSPPVVTVYALALDAAGRVLTGDDGARLAAGFSFVLGTRSVVSGLVVLRRPGSAAPSWLVSVDRRARRP